MKAILHIGLATALTLFCGCAAQPSGMALQDDLASQTQQDTSLPSAKPPIDARCSIEAAGDGWGLAVLWKTNEMTRYVDWKKGDAGFALALPLRRRPSPWTYTNGGITQTKFGPYQPALTHREGGEAMAGCHVA